MNIVVPLMIQRKAENNVAELEEEDTIPAKESEEEGDPSNSTDDDDEDWRLPGIAMCLLV